MNNSNRHLLKSSAMLYLMQIIISILALVKESVFASYFGISWQADAYAVASQIPTVLCACAVTAIKTIEIPLYSHLFFGGKREAADRYYSNLVNTMALGSIVLSAVVMVFSRQVVFLFAPGLSAESGILASKLLRYMMPTAVMLVILAAQSGVQNVHKRYVFPQIAGELQVIVQLACVILLASICGIYAMAVGLVIGCAVGLTASSILTSRLAKYHWVVDLKDENLVLSFKRAGPIFISVGASEFSRVVDRMISSFMQSGSIAALSYALRLYTAISALFINTITTLMFPVFSEKAAKKQLDDLAQIYVFSLSLFVLITIPLAVGAITLSGEVVELAFARGAFNTEAVEITSKLFALYFIGALFSGIHHTCARVFFSLGDTKTPMKNSIVGIAINIALNIILGYSIGVYGLAIAASVSTAIIAILLFRAVKKVLPAANYAAFFTAVWKACTAALVMTVAVVAARYMLSGSSGILAFLVSTAVGGLTYLALLLVLRTAELTKVLRMLKDRKLAGGGGIKK